jgi:predicted acylesterase/phospholipase RssA
MASLPFVLRAGHLARAHIEANGFDANSVAALGAPAGGPKFLILKHLDDYLFGPWLAKRRERLPVFGSSIGAFRLIAAAHQDPAAALNRLVAAYSAQHYSAKPDAAEVSRQVREMLDSVLRNDELRSLCDHPKLHLHLITARCKGLSAHPSTWLQAIGLGQAYFANYRGRDKLARHMERCVFHSGAAPSALLATDAFTTHAIALSADNLAEATLASGTIPLLMRSVRDIKGAPLGAHIDGGIVDYHMDMPLKPAEAGQAPILFVPHYESRLVPGWFDKRIASRLPTQADRLLVLSPAPELVARLPGHAIPSRQDFKTYHGRDADRLTAWRAAVDASREIAEAFAELSDRGRLLDALR